MTPGVRPHIIKSVLVFFAQSAAEFFPRFLLLPQQIHLCGKCSAHISWPPWYRIVWPGSSPLAVNADGDLERCVRSKAPPQSRADEVETNVHKIRGTRGAN